MSWNKACLGQSQLRFIIITKMLELCILKNAKYITELLKDNCVVMKLMK